MSPVSVRVTLALPPVVTVTPRWCPPLIGTLVTAMVCREVTQLFGTPRPMISVPSPRSAISESSSTRLASAEALVHDETSPFFTTGHFKSHPSVLLRAARIGELTRQELAELIQDAWLSRASERRAASWLTAHPVT